MFEMFPLMYKQLSFCNISNSINEHLCIDKYRGSEFTGKSTVTFKERALKWIIWCAGFPSFHSSLFFYIYLGKSSLQKGSVCFPSDKTILPLNKMCKFWPHIRLNLLLTVLDTHLQDVLYMHTKMHTWTHIQFLKCRHCGCKSRGHIKYYMHK